MNRRSFLKAIGLGTAAVAAVATGVVEFDPERALWVPGAKTFFLPPEKSLITDATAVQAEFNRINAQNIEQVGKQAYVGVRTVSTGVGSCEFDANWNLLRVNGRAVNAREAASYRLGLYQSDGRWAGDDKLAAETLLIIQQRVAAGIVDPIDEGERQRLEARRARRKRSRQRSVEEIASIMLGDGLKGE